MTVSPTATAGTAGDVTRILREIRSDRRWAEAKLNGETLRSLVERQPIFTFEGEGSWDQKRIVPQTAAAAELLTGPRGDKWEKTLYGILSLAQAREGADRMGGIAFSTSKDGFALGRSIMSMTHWAPEPADGERNVEDYFDTRADFLEALRAPTNAAASNGGMIAVGPYVSRALDRALAERSGRDRKGKLRDHKDWGTYATKVLSHEVEHSVSAPNVRSYNSRLSWLEESTAEVITEWPGWLDDVGRTISVPNDGRYSSRHKSYNPAVNGMRRVLRLAGVDTRKRSEFERASELVQGGNLTRTAGRLARAIVESNDLDEHHYEPIRTAIRDAAWTGTDEKTDFRLIEQRIRDLEAYVRTAS